MYDKSTRGSEIMKRWIWPTPSVVVVFTVVAWAFSIVTIGEAFAGQVKLVSDTWDNICKVQVTGGMNAPNTSIRTFRNVRRGWSATRTDKLCYRRSGRPRDCGSGYTNWHCASQMISGTYIYSLN